MGKGAANAVPTILRLARGWMGSLRFAHPTTAACVASLRHQRVHVLDGLGKIFLELLHHGAG